MQNFMKTILSAVMIWTKGKIKDSTADWNQNDSSADDYVKNRTHWEEEIEEATLVDNLTGEDYSNNNNHLTCTFVPGKKYDVIWNGALYEGLVCFNDGEFNVIATPDDGYPFYIDDDGGNGLCVAVADGSQDWILSIIGPQAVVHKLDPKYLPTNMATTDDVQVALDAANGKMNATDPVGTGSFSMNRKSGTNVGAYSHAEGYNTTASGEGSHAEGYYTTATRDSTVQAITKDSYTSNESYAHAEGYGTVASNLCSHAEGNGTTASGAYSHAEGGSTKASGNWSHADGRRTTASGIASHAEGSDTKASGYISHAEGDGTTASGSYSHAEGNGTTASGIASHAEGGGTRASGSYSHAEGFNVITSSYYSHAEGLSTTAQTKSQHVQGEYNILDTTGSATSRGAYAHIVGNGTSYTERSNAHTLDWNGVGWFQGGLQVGGSAQDDGAKNVLLEGDAVPIPETAEVGKVLAVKAVDKNGKPTEWEAVDFPEISTSDFVAQPDAPEDTTVLWLDTDDDSEISGGNAVLYTEQSLTEEQKAQARANIGAAAEKETTVITPIVPTGNTGWYVETGGNSLQASIYEMYFYEPIKINSNMKTLRLKNIHFNPYMAKVIFSNSPTLDDHPDISVATINASSEGVISCDVDIDTNYQYMYISTNAGSSGYINDTGAEYYIISTVINESSNSQIINLAERYDIVENDTLELFYSGILNVGNIQNFIVECDCDVGETYQRKFMFAPSADHAGKTYDLTLTVRDTYGNVVESLQTTIVVAESQETTAQITPTGNVGFYAQPSGVVQSETAGFYFHSPIALNSNMKTLRLANVLVNPYVAKIAYSNSPTLTLYETLSVVTLEGNDGDIVSVDIEIDNSYQYLYISANCTSSGVIQDTGAAYYIVSGPDEQKSGNVLCIGDSLTAEGTWVKEFQNRLTADGFDRVSLIGSQIADVVKHEGHAGWGYGSYLARNESNPFWNASTSQIDFANYMTNLGLSGQSIDYCVILLGWNETELSEEAFKANVNTFCTNLRNAYPDCKIMFVGLQIPSVDGLGANYGTSWHWKEKCDFVHNLDRWYQDVVSTMENAKVVQLCGQFDTEHNMPTGTRQVNRRNPVTETYGTNGVHPNEYGYLQIADATYRGFVGF